MNTMYKSSAYSIKRRLEAQIKAFKDIVEACNHALKCVNEADTEVKNNHIRERDLATRIIDKLTGELEKNRKDIASAMDDR